MATYKYSILKPLRKKIIVIAVMALLIVLCLASLLYQSSRRDYEESVLVNTLARQRMLTQMIAKDASRMHALMQALQCGTNVEPEDMVRRKISLTRNDLINARLEFAETLSSVHGGYIKSQGVVVYLGKSEDDIAEDLKKIDDLWGNFIRSTDVLISTDKIDKEVSTATIYINDHNESLLKYCDNITQTIVTNKKNIAFHDMLLSIGFAVLAFIVTAISLFTLYKYLIMPFDALYKGIAEMGITNQEDRETAPTTNEMTPVVSEIDSAFRKVNKLISLIENINKNLSFSEVLEFIFYSFSSFIPYSYIGLALVKDDGKSLEATYGISDGSVKGLPQRLLGQEYLVRETSLGKIIETGNARIISDLEAYCANKPAKSYTGIIMEAGIRASITLPLSVNGRPVGVIFFSSTEKNVYKQEHIKFLQALANSLAISLEKNIFVDNLIYSSILALAKLAEARDEDTGEHLERMKKYSTAITRMLYEGSAYEGSITPEYIEDIEKFSPMHDIGKVGIRDGILLKPAKLTMEEFEEMKHHTIYGAKVLKAAENNIKKSGKTLFMFGIEIAESHHERWDGSGYPYGKKGEEIPLSARIVAVADVFDALTSKRVYRNPASFEESFQYIAENAGKHFDPEIVKVFISNKEAIYSLYKSFQKND